MTELRLPPDVIQSPRQMFCRLKTDCDGTPRLTHGHHRVFLAKCLKVRTAALCPWMCPAGGRDSCLSNSCRGTSQRWGRGCSRVCGKWHSGDGRCSPVVVFARLANYHVATDLRNGQVSLQRVGGNLQESSVSWRPKPGC